MKTRNGFVSNSSSTSFTCDVCGETQSGMDMGLRECGMCRSENRHTFCEGHQLTDVKEFTIEEKRQRLIDNWVNLPTNSYYTEEYKQKQIQNLKENNEDEIKEIYDEFEREKGVDSRYCPICMFEEPHVPDLFELLLKKYKITPKDILTAAKQEFGTYEKLKEYLKAK